MDEIVQSSQGCSYPKILVARFQGLIGAPRGLLLWSHGLPGQNQEPQHRAHCSQDFIKETHLEGYPLHTAKAWRLSVWPFAVTSADLGWSCHTKNCPRYVILGAGCRRSLSWLSGYGRPPRCQASLSRVGRSMLVHILQVTTVTQDRSTPNMFALWQHLWKQWWCWGGNRAWKENG